MAVVRRNTWQREAVRASLEGETGFVSAQDLYASMRANGSPIGLATIYRALADLAAGGQADSLSSEDGEILYRKCESTSHHHHLICRSCGKTVEIEATEVERWASTVASEYGFSSTKHVIDIFGVCETCVLEK